MDKNIVNQDYWNDSYKDFKFYIAEDKITQFIDPWLNAKLSNKLGSGECFEVGCFPGRYLAHFSKKFQFRANGVDITTELNKRFFHWLQEIDIEIGEIVNMDALDYMKALKEKQKTFSFVYSIGFIEHFTNYSDVIDLHAGLVEPGGLLFLEVPNFSGKIQHRLHQMFDSENLARHVIDSMNPEIWGAQLKQNGNFEILFCGYFGGFKFWHDYQRHSIGKKILLKAVDLIASILQKIVKKNSKDYSPYCACIARRIQ